MLGAAWLGGRAAHVTDDDCDGGDGAGRPAESAACSSVVTRRGRQTGLILFAPAAAAVVGGGGAVALAKRKRRTRHYGRMRQIPVPAGCGAPRVNPSSKLSPACIAVAEGRDACACVCVWARTTRRPLSLPLRPRRPSPRPRPPAALQHQHWASMPRCDARPYCPKTLWIAGRGRHRTVLYHRRQQLPSHRNIAHSAGSLP